MKLTITLLLLTLNLVAQAQIPDLGANASLRGKRVLPADNPWNQDISGLPVDARSGAILAAVGMLPFQLGSTQATGAPIPYIIVPADQPLVPILFGEYGAQSDPGPYPVPPDAPIEGGPDATGDRHVIVIERDTWKLYEMFRAFPMTDSPGWSAAQGSVFDLNSNAVRPAGWTSADAAGLPIFPGLIRWDEVFELGEITHALRVTVPETSRAYIFPARHFASKSQNKDLPPMGLRVRLKAGYDISGFPAEAQVILRALKRYGMFVADNAARRPYWELICTPDPRWNDEALRTINRLTTADLEVVKMGILEPVFERVTMSAPSVVGGLSVSCTVTLRGPAPEGGLEVAVSSDSAAVEPAVTSLVVPAGATAASFQVRTRAVASVTTAYLRVSAMEYTETAKVVVNPVGVKSVVVSPSSVFGGSPSTGTVTLRAPAGPGPLTVALKTSHAATAVPASITIPEGQTTGKFTVATTPVAVNTRASITATRIYSASASLTVKAPTLLSVKVAPSIAAGGAERTGTITLSSPAPAGGTAVALGSSSSIAVVPANVTVPAGSSTVTFPVQVATVTARTSVTVTGKLGAAIRSATITVTP